MANPERKIRSSGPFAGPAACSPAFLAVSEVAPPATPRFRAKKRCRRWPRSRSGEISGCGGGEGAIPRGRDDFAVANFAFCSKTSFREPRLRNDGRKAGRAGAESWFPRQTRDSWLAGPPFRMNFGFPGRPISGNGSEAGKWGRLTIWLARREAKAPIALPRERGRLARSWGPRAAARPDGEGARSKHRSPKSGTLARAVSIGRRNRGRLLAL